VRRPRRKSSSPFRTLNPIPTLTPPLKGRESRAPIIAHYLAVGSLPSRHEIPPLQGEGEGGDGAIERRVWMGFPSYTSLTTNLL